MLPSRPFLGIESIRCFGHRELIVDSSVQTAGYYPNALGHALKRHYYKSNQRDDLGFCGLQWHHWYVLLCEDQLRFYHQWLHWQGHQDLPNQTARSDLQFFPDSSHSGDFHHCLHGRSFGQVHACRISSGIGRDQKRQGWRFWPSPHGCSAGVGVLDSDNNFFVGLRGVMKHFWDSGRSKKNFESGQQSQGGTEWDDQGGEMEVNHVFTPKKIKSPLSHFWGSLFCSFVEVLLFHILQHPFIIFDFFERHFYIGDIGHVVPGVVCWFFPF